MDMPGSHVLKPPARRTCANKKRTRGTLHNEASRFHAHHVDHDHQLWDLEPPSEVPATTVQHQAASSILTHQAPAGMPFDYGINPYRGCEHGCIYCYARERHEELGLSPGLDFETRLVAKSNAAALLQQAFARPGYRPGIIALGTATDCYQPIERTSKLTRAMLEVLLAWRHPVRLITKATLVLRDLDLLQELAASGLVIVHLSLITLDDELARRLEPRAAGPGPRLRAIERLAQAGVPVGVMVAPVIPVLTDGDIEAILEAARSAGAGFAHMGLLRLGGAVHGLFAQWLEEHTPDSARHVLARVAETAGPTITQSLHGQGPYAHMLRQRFALAKRRLGFMEPPTLRLDLFCRPGRGQQLELFP
jgi:DNA repair photolyase